MSLIESHGSYLVGYDGTNIYWMQFPPPIIWTQLPKFPGTLIQSMALNVPYSNAIGVPPGAPTQHFQLFVVDGTKNIYMYDLISNAWTLEGTLP